MNKSNACIINIDNYKIDTRIGFNHRIHFSLTKWIKIVRTCCHTYYLSNKASIIDFTYFYAKIWLKRMCCFNKTVFVLFCFVLFCFVLFCFVLFSFVCDSARIINTWTMSKQYKKSKTHTCCAHILNVASFV